MLLALSAWNLLPGAPGLRGASTFAIIPSATTNVAGSTIQLQVTQDGQSITQRFDFQWSRNSTNLLDDARIAGSQTAQLTLSNAVVEDTATYLVQLSRTNVVQATASAQVYVVDLPVVQDVASETVGDDVTFRVTATGGLLAYQWLWQGRPLAGATSSVLRFVNANSSANAGYYAVQVTNLAGAATSSLPGLLFTKPVPAGTYQGLFYEADAVRTNSSGFFQCKISSSKRSVSGKLTIGTKGYSFSGAFSPAHDAQIRVRRPQAVPLDLGLQLLTTNDTPQVIGTVSEPDWTASMSAQRLYFNSKNPTTWAGNYTLAFLNTNASRLAPNGHGFATVMVRPNGTAVLSGTAADGTRISARAGLSRGGYWPLYVSLYKGGGRLLSWLQFSGQAAGATLQGPWAIWLKNPGQAGLYPGGFYQVLQPAGSIFTLPASGDVLPFPTGVATFYAGDLFTNDLAVWSLIKAVAQDPNYFVAAERGQGLGVRIKEKNGLISGHFTDFVTGRKTSLKGVVLQQRNSARGFFLSQDLSGAFTLEPGP